MVGFLLSLKAAKKSNGGKNHHTGHFVAVYIEDPHKRQKCYHGRKNTLVKSVSNFTNDKYLKPYIHIYIYMY